MTEVSTVCPYSPTDNRAMLLCYVEENVKSAQGFSFLPWACSLVVRQDPAYATKKSIGCQIGHQFELEARCIDTGPGISECPPYAETLSLVN